MIFNYTDKYLNELNHGKNVYSVNDEYANRDENQTYTVVNKEDDNLLENEKKYDYHLRWSRIPCCCD